MLYSVLLLFGMAFPQEDGEVLQRGAIHEAFAQPVLTRATPGPWLERKPPNAIREVPPEEKPEGENVRWIGGYWRMDEEREDFVWVSGFWRQIPPGMDWISGSFKKGEEGWRWYPGFWKQIAVQPDEPVEEAPPAIPEFAPSVPAPQPNMIWSQGYWVWRGGAYGWRPGFWMGHRPGWVWNPTCWTCTPGGFVLVPGYWDYALEYRGFLFGSVYYSRPIYLRPGFYHRPLWVIQSNQLPGGLFVRTGYGNYFYGDYFRPAYANQGFQFWTTPGRFYGPDPIFSYYRMERHDPWAQSVRQYGRDRMVGKPAIAPTFVAVAPVLRVPAKPGAPVAIVPMGVGQGDKWVTQLPKKPPSLVSTYKAPPRPEGPKPTNLKPSPNPITLDKPTTRPVPTNKVPSNNIPKVKPEASDANPVTPKPKPEAKPESVTPSPKPVTPKPKPEAKPVAPMPKPVTPVATPVATPEAPKPKPPVVDKPVVKPNPPKKESPQEGKKSDSKKPRDG